MSEVYDKLSISARRKMYLLARDQAAQLEADNEALKKRMDKLEDLLLFTDFHAFNEPKLLELLEKRGWDLEMANGALFLELERIKKEASHE